MRSSRSLINIKVSQW